ncbi:YeiH family putative sulfate export transporter [Alkaliphilus pronyensis]|uniref:YeiH family putative sulfate export transporter n=1 Tax=Alkaliphilus pronyensis TaxID=1482732 RepID=A0A6I0FLM7_9FIRM|nr:YeiH family protein [Alkaliphilus pronyensis]KAB3539013.1 YeiH family putative sulfate export transporter [Alkaliphilus pronyensis]
MSKLYKLIPGFMLAFTIGLISLYLGKSFTIIGGPIFAILIAMLIASTCSIPNSLKIGIKFTAKKMLQLAIVLLGFQLNLFNVLKMGMQSLTMILFTISSVFIVSYTISKLLRIHKNKAILIAVGTAICGGSAIAATAPVIMAEDEEVAASISTIFLFNIVAVFVFPPIGRLLEMTDITFGLWSGLAINDTSSVVAAAQVWSSEALSIATIVKLTRTLMILPITMILSIYSLKTSSNSNRVNLAGQLPWFIVGFLFTSVIATLNVIAIDITRALVDLGKLLIIIAMAAIGLNTDIKQLMSNGIKPLALGLCCSITVAIVAIIVIKLLF